MSTMIPSLEHHQAVILNPLSCVFLVLFIILLKWFFYTPPANNKNQPPSPPRLPIIGNLHQLGKHPHHSLRSLAMRYGPLMKLHLGNAPAYVVSSADLAKDMLKTHDIIFSNRHDSTIYRRLLYDANDLLLVPYSEYWRQMRSICVMQLLSKGRVQSFQPVREGEVDIMIEQIKQSGLVDLTDLLGRLASDIVCRVAFGKKYTEGGDGKMLKKLFEEFTNLLGVFNIGEYVPWLDWINYVNGLYARVDRTFKTLDNLLDDIIQDHAANPNGDGVREHYVDFMEILLHIENGEIEGVSIAKDNIKAIIADIITGGSDTTFAHLEWAMTELIRHPEVMAKVQKEIREIVRSSNSKITKDDINKMDYLKAVIKETLRLHPSIPLLPRVSSKEVELHGYKIPANTRVFLNALAIGRDPNVWEKPDEFIPERFLKNNSIDITGQAFELIPFGGGRRGCPGITFAVPVIELVLSNLLHKFDWSLPGGVRGEDLDVDETSGLSVHKKNPLVLVATLHSY